MGKRWFSTLLPSRSGAHYVVSGTKRLPGARERIDRGEYFGVHGARQIGKTTALMGLAEELTAEGRYAALHVSCEDAARVGSRPWEEQEQKLVAAVRMLSAVRLPMSLWPEGEGEISGDREREGFGEMLSAWAGVCPRPIVLFLDDVERLPGRSLARLLPQIARGAGARPRWFPWSIVLCDGRVAVRKAGAGAAGLPEIEASLGVERFTRDEVTELLRQHTSETGQAFSEKAGREIFRLTSGDPLPVNMLARHAVEDLGLSPQAAITAKHIREAKAQLLESHFSQSDTDAIDSAAVARSAVWGRTVAGTGPGTSREGRYRMPVSMPVAWRRVGGNRIQEEVEERDPRQATRRRMSASREGLFLPDGRVAFRRVIKAFSVFWREHGEEIVREAIRKEEAPLGVLFGFLGAIVDLSGEDAFPPVRGRGPTFRMLRRVYRKADGSEGIQTRVLDVRVQREGQSSRRMLGLKRLRRNLGRMGLKRGTLILLDVRGRIGEREAVFEEVTTEEGYRIRVVEM